MSIHLYKHNEDAYRAVETMLEEKQMAAVIHPTGTGKSMIAFKLVEQHPHKHFLWLSPSEYIACLSAMSLLQLIFVCIPRFGSTIKVLSDFWLELHCCFRG